MSRVTLESGMSFGIYRVVRRLGAGAFGAVYEAVNLKLDKPVALKVLHADVAKNPVATTRFVQEAKSIAKIRHPHIIDIYDVDTFSEGPLAGVPYLAMELLQGESLHERRARLGSLSVEAALDVLLPLISAVNEVHRRGIIHRDIKPDNVFLTDVSGKVHPKLLDFGIAKVRTDSAVETVENAMIGTPAYSAPEQMTDAGNVGPESDQWSLAVTLQECLTGQLPFDSKTGGLQGLIVRLCTEDPTPLRSLRPELPTGLEAVILRALQKDRAKRFPSTAAFGAALMPFASALMRERFATEFRAEGGNTSTLPLSAPAAAERPPSLIAPSAPAYGSRSSLGETPESLLGISAAIMPPMHRPRWGVSVGLALAITVVGSALGLGISRLRTPPERPTRAAAVPITALSSAPAEPPHTPPAREVPPPPTVVEALPSLPPAPAPIVAAAPPVEPATTARPSLERRHRTREHAPRERDPRTHTSRAARSSRTAIPIVE